MNLCENHLESDEPIFMTVGRVCKEFDHLLPLMESELVLSLICLSNHLKTLISA